MLENFRQLLSLSPYYGNIFLCIMDVLQSLFIYIEVHIYRYNVIDMATITTFCFKTVYNASLNQISIKENSLKTFIMDRCAHCVYVIYRENKFLCQRVEMFAFETHTTRIMIPYYSFPMLCYNCALLQYTPTEMRNFYVAN